MDLEGPLYSKPNPINTSRSVFPFFHPQTTTYKSPKSKKLYQISQSKNQTMSNNKIETLNNLIKSAKSQSADIEKYITEERSRVNKLAFHMYCNKTRRILLSYQNQVMDDAKTKEAGTFFYYTRSYTVINLDS